MASNVSEFIIETTTESFGSLTSVPVCRKNPGHVGFYSLDNLTVDVLPEDFRTDQWLNYIRDYSKRIVRIIITKPNGGSLFGTGCVIMWHDDDSDSDSDSDKFYIITNEHVIGSQEDVSNCIVEWFYDTEDRAGIETSCGVKLLWCYKKGDWCEFTVNYIPETVKQLLYQPPDTPPDTDLEHVIAIAHPHGAPKTITFGMHLGVELVNGLYRWIHTAKTCGGCSGTRLLYTSYVNSPDSWRGGWYYTHYAGRRVNVVYNIKKPDGTYKPVTSDTNNINYSVWGL